MVSPASAIKPMEQLAIWRDEGADRCDPLRFRTIEAMLVRAAAYDGAARHVLDEKLAHRIAAYAALLGSRPDRRAAAPARTAPVPSSARSPLAQLLDHLSGHEASARDAAPASQPTAPGTNALPELKSVRHFRGTWSRLRADRSLLQSQSTLPDNAGPLNSHNLVHRSLRLMRDASPDYLNRFMVYVDALGGLEPPAGAAAPATSAPRATTPRKQGRGKGA